MAAPFALDEPINRIAFETYVEKVLILAPDGVSSWPNCLRRLTAASRDAGEPEKSSPIPCYFGRLRLERRHVSRPPHPWRLAGDVQRAAIAAFNFLKSKD
jgi:hypothetical protein